jgi:hypothetical protein
VKQILETNRFSTQGRRCVTDNHSLFYRFPRLQIALRAWERLESDVWELHCTAMYVWSLPDTSILRSLQHWHCSYMPIMSPEHKLAFIVHKHASSQAPVATNGTSLGSEEPTAVLASSLHSVVRRHIDDIADRIEDCSRGMEGRVKFV